MHRILRLPAALIADVKRLIRWLGRAAVLAEAAEIDLAAFLARPAALRRTGLALTAAPFALPLLLARLLKGFGIDLME